jgi:DNA-binding transcriptional LysR family regulator
MKDYLSEMRSFAAVMENGGFTHAAKALGVSKGLISQHVKRLESELGAQLLFRSTR